MSHWPAYIVPRINQIFTRDLTGSSIKGISGMNGAASAEALARERRLSYLKPIIWTKLGPTKNMSPSKFHFGATLWPKIFSERANFSDY